MASKRDGSNRSLNRRYSDFAIELGVSILQGVGTERSRDLAGCLERGSPGEVVGASIEPGLYSGSWDFRRDYLAVELMSKFPSFDLGIDRVKVALTKFLESEEICRKTNDRLASSYGTSSTEVSVASLLHVARRKIATVLGDFSWDEAEAGFAWGPGASTRVSRRKADAYYKFQGLPETTTDNSVLAVTAISRVPLWRSLLGNANPGNGFVKIVPGNRIITVPKNAKTERTIAIEPCMNMFVQKGLGSMIRRRLRRVGVDLNSQERNQQLAREGSLTGELATIDLSMASDTVSREIVSLLLPPDWVEALEQCRSPVGELPSGELIYYQKFSSMGNGFTFELESLIFWALVRSVIDTYDEKERRVAVYGDDIVVSSAAYPRVVGLLEFCGFSTNAKKSFASGPFRESCGKHYFLGADVTPFYVRSDVDTVSRLMWYANSVSRWAHRAMEGAGRWSAVKPTYDLAVSKLPPGWRTPRIPDGFGDGALVGDFCEVTPRANKEHRYLGWAGWNVSHIVEENPTVDGDDLPAVVRALYHLERRHGNSESAASGLSKPDERKKVRRVTSVVRQWADLGPWL